MGVPDLIAADPYLEPFRSSLEYRVENFKNTEKKNSPGRRPVRICRSTSLLRNT